MMNICQKSYTSKKHKTIYSFVELSKNIDFSGYNLDDSLKGKDASRLYQCLFESGYEELATGASESDIRIHSLALSPVDLCCEPSI